MGKRKITPAHPVWLAGYGFKRVVEGIIHDLWAKVITLKSSDGQTAVLVTTDHQGISATIYERLARKVYDRFRIEQKDFMLTFSHNHSGPCLQDDLQDYYPSDEEQKNHVVTYTLWMEEQILDAIGDALEGFQPVQLSAGEGNCTFAVNRRENAEAEVPAMREQSVPLKGIVDHSVPVLAVKDKDQKLLAVLFGYACHPTTLNGNFWNGDYPGFAQLNLEASYPGAMAMFFNTCGGDQNPIPRRTVELCERYGRMLSDAVRLALESPMEPVSAEIATAFGNVDLEYEELATEEKLLPIAKGESALHARWAGRMLGKLESGEQFSDTFPYPVQAWKLGKELLLIGLAGEAVVDYGLRFKKEFDDLTTWVCGYANQMVSYIPSGRIWEEGGYEGAHIDEYGHPAWRWKGDLEDRIVKEVRRVTSLVRKSCV